MMRIRQITTVRSTDTKYGREYVTYSSVPDESLPEEEDYEKERRRAGADRLMVLITWENIWEELSQRMTEEAFDSFMACHNVTLDNLAKEVDDQVFDEAVNLALHFIQEHFEQMAGKLTVGGSEPK